MNIFWLDVVLMNGTQFSIPCNVDTWEAELGNLINVDHWNLVPRS